MHNLREAKDCIIKAVVEPMNEDKHLPPGNSAQGLLKPGNRLRPIDHLGLEGDEVRGRIAGYLSWPLHLTDLSRRTGWEGDCDVRKSQRGPTCARKHLKRIPPLACGGHEHIDPAADGAVCADWHQHADRGGARRKAQADRENQGSLVT